MEEIIREMIQEAEEHHDYELAEIVYKILRKFAWTINCPSNWRDLGEELADEYNAGWVYENCKLYDFKEED